MKRNPHVPFSAVFFPCKLSAHAVGQALGRGRGWCTGKASAPFIQSRSFCVRF